MYSVDALGHLGAAGAAFLAGGINAVAGGGTLVSFPVLLGLGVPSVAANATNTVALCPGYFGGALAQRADLAGRTALLKSLLVVAAAGGLAGSILLVLTSDELFSTIVPFLILAACLLLGLQTRIRAALRIGERTGERHRATPALLAGTFVAALYGGYFGAGLGIMLLAILGV
ncbi:MAG TPA: sulfite exporter TauE/SafE family protein, partial [Acidimicrobiales bacterium]